MSDPSTRQHLAPLPDSLRKQLEKFRKHLWRIKITEAILAGLLGLIISFGLVFALDRIWDLSPLTRLIILTAGVSLFAVFAPFWINRWVFKHRKENQLARLISNHYPKLGDRLLGVVELQDQNESNSALSPKLREAAMIAVAHDAKSQDLQQALSSSWLNKLAMAVTAVAIVAGVSFVIYPSAGKNALQRWLMPLSDTERFVFTKIDLSGIPQPLYVPLDEPFSIQLPLSDDTEQTPEYAEARYGTSSWQRYPLQDYRYQLDFKGQRYKSNVSIKIGDANHLLDVRPIKRPQLTETTARITYPKYLQRPAVNKSFNSGKLDILEGSSIDLNITANRQLSKATVGPVTHLPKLDLLDQEELEIQGPSQKKAAPVIKPIGYQLSKNKLTILPDTLLVEKSTLTLPVSWTDIHGISGITSSKLQITPAADNAPTTYIQSAEKQIYILHSEVLKLDLVAEDDYGIKAAGLQWIGSFTTPTAQQPARGEENFIQGDPFNTIANENILLDFAARDIIPQKLTIRTWVDDYNPATKRVYSEPIEVFVLSDTEHANYIKERMKAALSDLEDSMRREQENLDENKRIQKDLNDPKKAAEAMKKLADQENKELDNKDAVKKLTKEMKEIFKEAMKNKNIDPKTLKDMKDTTEQLKKMAQKSMPKIAQKLADAQDKKNSKEKSKEDLKKAIEEQEKLIKEMKKAAQKGEEANKKLEAGTFVQRLKKAASDEGLIIARISSNQDDLISKSSLYAELDPKIQRLSQVLYLQQEQTSADVRWIIEDLGFFYARTQKEAHGKLLEEMRKSSISDKLVKLEYLLENALGSRSRVRADELATQLRKWAKQLDNSNKEDKGGGGDGGGASSQEDQDFEFMLRVMRMVQKEVAIRGRTRALEQQLRNLKQAPALRNDPIIP